MTDPLAGTQLHGVDKSLPLSNEDFLKLIINQSYIISEDRAKYEREQTKEDINSVTKVVIEGFSKKLSNLITSVNTENNALVDKIKDLALLFS